MFSLKVTGEDLHKSTFKSSYSQVAEELVRKQLQQNKFSGSSERLSLIKSKKSIEDQNVEKFCLPSISHKHKFYFCLGLGTSKSAPLTNTKKPIVRDKPPQDKKIIRKPKKMLKNKSPMDMTLEELFLNHNGIATTERENRKYCLPVPDYDLPESTLEKNADMFEETLERLRHRRLTRKKNTFKLDLLPRAEELTMASQCKEKKMPGYGGYIPTDPVGCTYDPYFDRYYKPTTLQTYKPIPLQTYNKVERRYSHKHTIFHVSPFRPFPPRSLIKSLSNINRKHFF